MKKLLSNIFCYIPNEIKDSDHKERMAGGYPLTAAPFVPKILKHQVEYKTIKNKAGYLNIGLALAPEGSELVNSKCLEYIRKLFLAMFASHPNILKELGAPLPRNVIGVSFSEMNFQVGSSCQEFLLNKAFKVPENTFFSYQKFSENLQATYYNENGIQFLAGICYYPTPNGKRKYLKNDEALFYWIRASAEPYPLQDRNKSLQKIQHKRYGTYCKETGKRVLVDCSGKYGTICHVVYEPQTNYWYYPSCEGCLEDYFTYKWKDSKSKKGSPASMNLPNPSKSTDVPIYSVTRHPFHPDILKHTAKWKTIKSAKGFRKIGFTLAPDGSELVNSESLEIIRMKLLKWLQGYPEIMKEFEKPFPRNTISISFAECNFQLGKSCQDFSPNSKFKMPEDAYFTYQKLSENLQATYYNENGTEFLAGICYYPVPSGTAEKYLPNDKELIYLCQMSAVEYPLTDRNKHFNKIHYQKYGRYCGKAGKRVVVDCSEKYGTICHMNFNQSSDSWMYTQCDECLEDSVTYKWEKPKNEITVSLNLPTSSTTTNQLKSPTTSVSSFVTASSSLSSDGNEKSEATNISTEEQTKLPDLDFDAGQTLQVISTQTFEELIRSRIQDIQNNEFQKFDDKIRLFNRITRELLGTSKCPKITELSDWLAANHDYNVCNSNALIAHLSLGLEYRDRIGGDDVIAHNDYTSVLSTSVEPSLEEISETDENAQLTSSTTDSSELESEDQVFSHSPTSSSDEYDKSSLLSIVTHSSASSEFSKISSSASLMSSTERLMKDYDKIEFDAEMINFN